MSWFCWLLLRRVCPCLCQGQVYQAAWPQRVFGWKTALQRAFGALEDVFPSMSFRMLADVCFIACLPLETGYLIAVGSLETLRLTLGCCRWLFGLKVSSVSVVAVKRNIVISDIQCWHVFGVKVTSECLELLYRDAIITFSYVVNL